MARQQDSQREGIVLDDGTWVDVGRDGRWHPSAGERTRAAVILGVSIALLAVIAMLMSVGGDDDDPDDDVLASEGTSSTTEEPVVTSSTTTAPIDPASVAGTPPPAQCVGDDRDGVDLRERSATAVLVLNATNRTGHAARIVQQLQGLGYESTVPGNGGRLRTSVLGYVPGYCAEAVRLGSELGLAQATYEPVDAEGLPVPLGRARIVATVGADTVGQ